jgi:uncharacterized lipoprotein YmbA
LAILRRRLLLAGLLPATCASPNPTLYTLATVPGRVLNGPARVVEVRAVAIARYLERSQIVRSSEDYRLDIMGNDWWGEPLDAMLTRVLVQDLTQRLPRSTVFGDNGAVSATPDLTLGLNVQRFDQGKDGAVVLAGQMALSGGKREQTRTLRLTEAPSGPGTAELVGAMSALVGQVADTAATLLAG